MSVTDLKGLPKTAYATACAVLVFVTQLGGWRTKRERRRRGK